MLIKQMPLKKKTGRAPETTFPQRRHTDGRRIDRKTLRSLIIREMQITATARCRLTPGRAAGEDVEHRDPAEHWNPARCRRGCKRAQPLWEPLRGLLKHLKIQLPCDPAIPLLGVKKPTAPMRKDSSAAGLPARHRWGPGWGRPRRPEAAEWTGTQHRQDGVSPGHGKGRNLALCDGADGPRGTVPSAASQTKTNAQ